MALNKDLLKKTVAYILDNPEKWNQAHWAIVPEDKGICGTAFCFAGTALHLAYPGALLVGGFPSIGADDGLVFESMVLPQVGKVDISEFAETELGLTDEQADVLFDSDNKLPTILRMVAALLDDENVDLYDLMG